MVSRANNIISLILHILSGVDVLQEPGFLEYIGDRVVVLGHNNADPDAVGAAQGVRELVEKLKPNVIVEVVMPDDISRLSMNIIEELGLDIKENSSSQFDTVIVVDSSGLNQLGEWDQKINKNGRVTILIDHHTLEDESSRNFDLLIHDDTASSTCELVYRLYEKYDLVPTIRTSRALLAGILFDSKFLSIGSSQTFQVVSDLLENIGDISEVRSMLYLKADVSERIARLKTSQRSEIYHVGDYVVVFSEVGSFQASGARALIALGADLAIVIGSEKYELRASLRSSQSFFDQTDLHLGELVSEISEQFTGFGSGHPTAAGFNGSGQVIEFKKALLDKIKEKINNNLDFID